MPLLNWQPALRLIGPTAPGTHGAVSNELKCNILLVVPSNPDSKPLKGLVALWQHAAPLLQLDHGYVRENSFPVGICNVVNRVLVRKKDNNA